jgi:Abnormal spindle-like microcephaly-assoc'd, ASPM-SPD-2-Hydin
MLVALGLCARFFKEAGIPGSAPWCVDEIRSSSTRIHFARKGAGLAVLLFVSLSLIAQQPENIGQKRIPGLPPRVAQAQRFLARRGGAPARRFWPIPTARANALPAAQSPANIWQPLGPAGVLTTNYGLVTGRVSALALDPSDPTGNRLFVGTTGGGVWMSQNAAASNAANIRFTPLTDNLPALINAPDASISIGALSVQPGGTGVILAGTGDPNDALDSYYGGGVLRSADGGRTWTLIQFAAGTNFSFLGEGFAGFAWSTVNPNLVVAAVSQAFESVLVGALRGGRSYEGLYYSTDSGASWALAQITDLNGQDVQGPTDAFATPDGNASTSVVWNPVRRVFIAAVRFHGYYQSPDGSHWTRLASQPGSSLTTAKCPTRPTSTGSTACPIYRGTLAVNPFTGDTFAWTVDLADQDQGIWQDRCSLVSGSCSQAIAFTKQWNTGPLQTDSQLGSATLPNGSYNLALAAVPSGQDTILLAGANDLWQCSLAMGCVWRNTTNATSCLSARVGEYQHALEWNPANPLELFVGNDSGLWRSTDGIAESGPVCSASDAAHFQNLNGALGSLSEVESMSAVGASPYTMLLGLGANGSAGVKDTNGPTLNWPQVLTGEGGPVAIDPAHPANWYVNDGAGVSIQQCSQDAPCTPADFNPVVSNADVHGDGFTMGWPAPFLVDPLDPSQLLVATCRIWRGPASGNWTDANAVSPMFDGNKTSPACNGNALLRSIAALPIAGGGEIVYAGTYGSSTGLGATIPGHVLSATMDATGAWSTWTDLAFNPVVNDQATSTFNPVPLDISSIYIDPHDLSGKTIYVTIAGVPNFIQYVRMAYRSTDGGAHWYDIQANLPPAAANSLVIDPKDAHIAYIATDAGVFVTRDIAACATSTSCWALLGSGLPNSPVVALSAAPPSTSPNVLVAGTYGRGVWQVPLLTADVQLTTATLGPSSVDFGSQGFGKASSPQPVTLTNTGAIALVPGTITVSGDFSETDNCAGATINAGASCTIQLIFRPSQSGSRSGQLTVSANISGGSLNVALSGVGQTPGLVNLSPGSIDFGQVQVGTTSTPLPVTAENGGETAVAITSITVTGPFILATNACGTTSLQGNSDCQMQLEFVPTSAGPATGALTIVDDAGQQSIQLAGIGAKPPTDTLSVTSLPFPATETGKHSDWQDVTLTNSGDAALGGIAVSVSGPFEFSSKCTTILAKASSCAISVRFAPTQLGLQTGALTVADILNAGQVIALSGTGVKPAHLVPDPASLTFAAIDVGVTSAPSVITLSNDGGVAVTGLEFDITPSGSGFAVAAGANPCGSTLLSGGQCSARITFTPASSGTTVGTLSIVSQNLGPVLVSLKGTGRSAAGLNVNPTELAFPAQELNQPSAAKIITVSNSGASSATGLSLAVTGPFSLAQNNCGTGLSGGSTCTTAVIFTPVSRGPLAGVLTVTASNVTPPATVALSGIGGLTGAVRITPAQVSFPITGVGATSSPTTLTIVNSNSGVDLNNLQFAVSAEFKTANDTCGVSLRAGATCALDVSFVPAKTGPQTGTLTLTSDQLESGAAVPLSGVGFDFQASVSGASSQTVSSGQTASYQLSVANPGGSTATFTLACGSLPSYAACVFSPSSTSVSANGTGSAGLQITTSQASSAALPAHIRLWRPLTALCVVVLLPLATRRRRRALILPFLVVSILIASCVTGCSSSGGGGGGTTPPSAAHTTPPGTYSIPVIVSSTGVQHTVILTLVVD